MAWTCPGCGQQHTPPRCDRLRNLTPGAPKPAGAQSPAPVERNVPWPSEGAE
jgi:hypothetical protein